MVSYPPGLAVVFLFVCSFLIILHKPGVGFYRKDTEVGIIKMSEDIKGKKKRVGKLLLKSTLK